MNALIAYLFKKCIIALIVNFKTTRNILQKLIYQLELRTHKNLLHCTKTYLIHGVFSVKEINYANKRYEFIKTTTTAMFQLILLRVVDFLYILI